MRRWSKPPETYTVQAQGMQNTTRSHHVVVFVKVSDILQYDAISRMYCCDVRGEPPVVRIPMREEEEDEVQPRHKPIAEVMMMLTTSIRNADKKSR